MSRKENSRAGSDPAASSAAFAMGEKPGRVRRTLMMRTVSF